jgi:hypothetical protein
VNTPHGGLVPQLEVAEFPGWFLPENLDARYCGRRWTLAAEGDQGFHVFLLSLKDGFDSAVTKVPHPTCHAVSAGHSPSLVSEEDSLDEPADEDMSPSSQVS